jgi:hypothetical protein
MPQTLALYVATALLQAGATVGVASAAITAVTLGAQIAIAAGLSFVASLLAPKPQAPKPSDVKTEIKEPTQPRLRHYGIVRASGVIVFVQPKGSYLYKLIATGTDRVSSILEYYINDEPVTLDASGYVIEYKTKSNVRDDRAQILTRLGLPTETAYGELITAFPGIWTSQHRGDGVSSILAVIRQPPLEDMQKVFPNGTNTTFSAVYETSLLFDPRDGTKVFKENAALVIRDYLVSEWGFRLANLWVENANAEYITAANVCDEAVPLKAGGTEPRWRIGMSYSMVERPADVLQRMLDACDGMIYPTPNMGIALKAGRWEEPTVTLDADSIASFSGLTRGGDVLTRANLVTARYTSCLHRYSEQEADPWLDDDDIAENGEIATDMELFAVPSHSQCRRLMKIRHRRANPKWRGTIVCNLRGLAVLGERFIRVTLPDYGLDAEPFEIQGQPAFIMGEDGATVTGVSIDVASMSAEAWAWDAATEEGTAPAVTEDITQAERVLPVPSGFMLSTVIRIVQGNAIPFANFTADAPEGANDSILFEVSTDDGTTWIEVPHDRGINTVDYGPLEDGITYLGRATTRSATNRLGAPTATQSVTSIIRPDLASNGAFANADNWTLGEGWTISGNRATHSAGVTGTLMQENSTLIGGRKYRIIFTVPEHSVLTVRSRIESASSDVMGAFRTAVGTYSEDLIAPANPTAFGLWSNGGLSADDFSIRLVD